MKPQRRALCDGGLAEHFLEQSIALLPPPH
jgi:hypothetical protein